MLVVGADHVTVLIPSRAGGQVISRVVDQEFRDESRCVGVQLGLYGGDGGLRGGRGVWGVYRGGSC